MLMEKKKTKEKRALQKRVALYLRVTVLFPTGSDLIVQLGGGDGSQKGGILPRDAHTIICRAGRSFSSQGMKMVHLTEGSNFPHQNIPHVTTWSCLGLFYLGLGPVMTNSTSRLTYRDTS